MGKADKRLFVLVTALILSGMGWFMQFSQTQQNAIYTDSIVQIIDATKTACAKAIDDRPNPIAAIDARRFRFENF